MAVDNNGYQCVVGIDEFLEAGVRYDYIIVGGGTAGLVLANRLSESPDVYVAVVEAGRSHISDPRVLTPALFVTMPGDHEYDWDYQTTLQVYQTPLKSPRASLLLRPANRVLRSSATRSITYSTEKVLVAVAPSTL
jgi:NADH dehydrogenase FAD-containing subunit